LRDAARKATKKDASGKVTQAGLIRIPIKDWDSGVVHPWTSLLWSNGGQFVSEDNSTATFNQQPGLETLQLELDMIADGSIDLALVMEDFIAGKAAMIVMANWWGADLRAGMTGGMENVGVAPVPHNEGDASVTLQYNWLWGVDRNSQNAEASWALLKCLNSPKAAGGSSPMGDFLTTGLNAIPGRTSDQEAHADVLGDPFVKPFVDALANARTEPIIPGAQEIKTSLQKQIEAAWFGQTPAQEALDNAANEANRILAEKAQT
jgi:multiple sugar transport system substrate-binding protein